MSRLPTILLVEDNLADQEMTRRALQQVGREVQLEVVEDGEQALDYLFRRDIYSDLAEESRPDLILLDLNLPKVSGKEVLKQIRADQNLQNIPVIVLSTTQHEDDVVESYRAGCNSFLSKPTRYESFVKTMTLIVEYWFDAVQLPPRG